MDWTITLHSDEHTSLGGATYPEQTNTYSIPFKLFERVYIAIKKRSKWMLVKTYVLSMWATNMYGIRVAFKDMMIPENEFDTIFKDKNEAIEFCLAKNAQAKVKIHYDTD